MRARRRIARFETIPPRPGSRPSEMFSATLRVGASWNSWWIIRIPSARALLGFMAECVWPLISIEATSGE